MKCSDPRFTIPELSYRAEPLKWRTVVCVPDVFDQAEIDRILGLVDPKHKQDGAIGSGDLDQTIRRARVAPLVYGPTTEWVYERLTKTTTDVNGKHFGYDLLGFDSHLQYTEVPEGGVYDWHVDIGPRNYRFRKLSVSVLLDDGDMFTGGHLETAPAATFTTRGDRALMTNPSPGTAIFFPSWLLHRVTLVNSGLRRSLVGWCVGPSFS